MLENLLDLVFPPKCELCGIFGNYICSKCYNELKKYQLKNKKEEKFFLYKYEEQIRKMLIKYKFNGSGYLCNLFSTCISNNEEACKFISSYDILIPVPIHRKRKNERGYNQTELIAKKIVRELHNRSSNTRLDIRSLKKIKNTKPQSTLKLQDRINSVKGAYKVENVETIKEKKVLIFDDIYTMGNTYNECKNVLLEAGAKEVGILTIARDFMKY